VLKKPDKGEEILAPAKQTQYCSGVGKKMHMMQYDDPFGEWITNCIRATQLEQAK
jgi:hypothetical protein